MAEQFLLYQTEYKFFIAPMSKERMAELEERMESSRFMSRNSDEEAMFSLFFDDGFDFPGHELKDDVDCWPEDNSIFSDYESNDGISIPHNQITLIDQEFYEQNFQSDWEDFLAQREELLSKRNFDRLFAKLKPILATSYLEAMGEVFEEEHSSEFRLIRLTTMQPEYTNEAFLERMREIARGR